MDRPDRSRVEDLFQRALDLQPAARDDFVRAHAPDPQVAKEVRTLLRHYEGGRDILSQPPPTFPHPQTVGPFTILGVLGEGGMGTVYLAEQAEPLVRRVALKVIRGHTLSAQIVARFEAERQVLAMLDHPGIARIYEAGSTEHGQPWFAMEYAPGQIITSWCDEHRLNLRARLNLFLGVCEAIEHAHQRGVVHRDIKPGNILVAGDPADGEPKVIDFGIAKLLDQGSLSSPEFTRAGDLVGTPEYMSPEQAASKPVDTRTDVYALGLLLYELLVGVPPIERQRLHEMGVEAMLRAIREEDPPPPSSRVSTAGEIATSAATNRATKPRTLSRNLRGDLDWIVMRALEKEPPRRYGSAAAMAADLRRHIRNEPVEARPPSAPYRARKFVRRNRVPVLVACTLMVASLAIAVVSTVQSRRVAIQRDLAEHEAAVSREVARFLGDVFHEAAFNRDGSEDTVTLHDAVELGVESLGEAPSLPEESRMRLLQIFGSAYSNLGHRDEALALAEQAVELTAQQFGDAHLQTAQARYTLVPTLRQQNDVEGAIRQCKKILPTFARELGFDDPQTLRCRWLLSASLSRLGRFGEALEHLDVLVEAYPRVYGADSTKLAMLYGEVALAYVAASRLDDAIALDEQGLELLQSHYGEDSAMTVMALEGLASRYRLAGRNDEALATLDRLTSVIEATLGSDHPQMIVIPIERGQVFQQQGRYADALEVLTGAMPRLRKVERSDFHTEALLVMASCARRLGDLEASNKYLREASANLEQGTGPVRRYENLILRQMSDNALSSGDEVQAESLAEQALAIARRDSGEQHPSTAMAKVSLAAALLSQQRLVKAEELLVAARTDLERMWPSGNPRLEWAESVWESLLEARDRLR